MVLRKIKPPIQVFGPVYSAELAETVDEVVNIIPIKYLPAGVMYEWIIVIPEGKLTEDIMTDLLDYWTREGYEYMVHSHTDGFVVGFLPN